ncbi:MAG: FtsW/RodA/SpoVE family cell cycle protein [Clostridia bacterium]|nr:FtsW/RodA/SpoVE family cell cycle protein [Clostridia bacterium]
MAKRQIKASSLMQVLLRSNTRLLLSGVIAFQISGMLLLAMKTSPPDWQALLFAAAMPCASAGIVRLFSALWKVDRALLILMLFLCSVSLVTLEDIARSAVTPWQQATHMLGGFLAMALGILTVRKLRRYEKWFLPLSAAAVAGVALPLVFGQWHYGAKNWIHLFGGVSVQPAEFGKCALILLLACGLANRPRMRQCVVPLAVAAALCGLLLAERDLGALLLYFLVTCAAYFAATGNLPVTLMGLGAGVAGGVLAVRMFPYVQKRIEVWQNPWSDPLDKGWQIIQALIAIGSGGLFGMGLGLGYPRNIPLYNSDFIFAAICEEFGLVFAVGLILIYVIIILRGISVAMNARTSFHMLIAVGVVVLIGVQAFIIIGGNVKMIPLTGVTLPFVSTGGSSIISMMGAFGMLLGVSSVNAYDEAEDLKRLEWREANA